MPYNTYIMIYNHNTIWIFTYVYIWYWDLQGCEYVDALVCEDLCVWGTGGAVLGGGFEEKLWQDYVEGFLGVGN